jgi:peptide/nickel transport system ATP-binding protein
MLLSVKDLKVSFKVGKGQVAEAVGNKSTGVSFDVPENSTVALVGESGSGKSVTAMSILNLLPENAIRQGSIQFMGREMLKADMAILQEMRGKDIACIFQEPMTSLNPVFTVGAQVAETLIRHAKLSPKAAQDRVVELFTEVGLPEPKRRVNMYPHEMSGGQQQRVMIAMALACEPKLLIADEPTTALDVTIQRQILELLRKLKDSHKMSMLFISHDLGVVGEVCDHVVVMRHGVVREQGPVAQIFASPQDSYTKALLACRPTLENTNARLLVIDDHMQGNAARAVGKAKDANAPVVLEVKSLAKSFMLKDGLFKKREFKAVKDVNFQLRKGYTLGVVGESGSGKTTMGLTLLRLHEPTGGQVLFDGKNLLNLSGSEWNKMRRRIQIVFQNPYASLNPRFTVGQTLLEPMQVHNIGANDAQRTARAQDILRKVGLDANAFGKYPHEFSGGQRQRIAIARCLTLNPEVLILDEAVSALDVSVQAQVLNLLKDLQDELGLAYVFISHDLAVVNFMADEVLVMKDGEVIEQADAQTILKAPQQDYTKRLLSAIPKGFNT